MRFGIRRKLTLIIAALALALIIASVLVSSQLYSMSLERSVREGCAESADSLAAGIFGEHSDFIRNYSNKIVAVYNENREILEEASEIEFESYDKREEFYDTFTEGIFPPKNAFGLSYEMAVFRNEYSLVLESMDMLSYAGGLDTASVFYYDDEHGNIVYLIDRMPEGSTLYSFPASVKKPWNDKLKKALEAGGSASFTDKSESFGLSPIPELENKVFVLFSKQNSDIPQSVRLFSLYTFAILLGATLLIGMVLLLFADKLIVRNVKKLAAASERFTSQIHGGSPEKVSAEIASKDEIGDLSNKFDIMQGSILGYIGSLAEKTSREEKIKAELELAARIQSESLPRGGLRANRAVLSSFLKPAKEVGGDLYDHFMLDDDRMFFCLADVSGKGIPASLFMMRAKEIIKAGVRANKPLDEFAFMLNNELCAGNEESIFITAFFGILDSRTLTLSFLRAGHEEPFLKRGGEIMRIGSESNYVLGVFEDVGFRADEIQLLPGDTLLAFTDGLNEGINEEAEAFGYERIEETLGNTDDEDVTGAMYEALCAFCGSAEQFDDVTMLSLHIEKGARFELDDPDYNDITRVTDGFLKELNGFEPDRVSEVGLLTDEIMNNQISYAFKEKEHPHIDAELEIHGCEATLVFEDNGSEFDPLSDPTESDVGSSEGGFGIRLIKELSDSQTYERDGEINRLTITKSMR